MNKSGQNLISLDDIIYANSQITGKVNKTVLSDQDKRLLNRIKQVVGAIEDGPMLRKIYKNAAVQ